MTQSRMRAAWVTVLPNGLLGLVALGALAVAAAGPLYRLQVLELADAFALMRGGAVAALALSGLGLVLLVVLLRRPEGRWRCVAALVLAAPAFLWPWSMMRTAAQLPAIHDISTDLADPPTFQVLAARQRPPELATRQRQGYGDLSGLTTGAAPGQALEEARAVAQAMGWEIVSVRPEAGRIEAVATTLWWGFRDDVVVRVAPVPTGSKVDVRSVSRVGVSDLGKNAERIRQFLGRLRQRLEG